MYIQNTNVDEKFPPTRVTFGEKKFKKSKYVRLSLHFAFNDSNFFETWYS